jgi:shikimate kinase
MSLADRHLVLVGLMGTGKTTVGREVAARLGRAFSDSDELIEARTGTTVREIFRAEGEPAFRVHEAAALLDALAADTPSVIAAAGGVVLSPENRAALRSGRAIVVWLRADPVLLVARAATGEHRPLLDDDPLGTLQRMAAVREQLYAEVADATVDVGSRSVVAVVDAVLAAAELAAGELAAGEPAAGAVEEEPR